MATVINNPSGTTQEGSGVNTILILAVLAFLVFLYLVFVRGINFLGNAVDRGSGPNITVPDQIDVNVNPQNLPQTESQNQ